MNAETSLPRVVAVLLNYNNTGDTVPCVRSLAACGYKNLSVVVVDNQSTDGSYETLVRSLPGAIVLRTGANLGFTGGNNFGIRHALKQNPEYVLIINNDTEVSPDFLHPLVDALEGDANVAAAGGTVCFHPDKERVWYGGGSFVAWRGSSFTHHVGENADRVLSQPQQKVTFITGCLMLIRASVLAECGMFDDRFFIYCEDAELSVRFVAAGYSLLYVPRSVIYHKVRYSGSTPRMLYFSVRNRLLLVRLALAGSRKIPAYAYLTAVTLLKAAAWAFVRPPLSAAMIGGAVDFVRGNFSAGRGMSFGNARRKP